MSIIINPGTEAIPNASEAEAIVNMNHFLLDCGVDGLQCARIPDHDYDKEYGNGRFAFLVWKETRCHEIQMPGLPLERVRYMDNERQNIWDFPRLYVDGSSYAWKFALLDDDQFQEPEEQ